MSLDINAIQELSGSPTGDGVVIAARYVTDK